MGENSYGKIHKVKCNYNMSLIHVSLIKVKFKFYRKLCSRVVSLTDWCVLTCYTLAGGPSVQRWTGGRDYRERAISDKFLLVFSLSSGTTAWSLVSQF